ncbi:MAG TPA: DUF5388 domain-containing protein [Ureibacillus sp.]|nr:DUF5388 domain-containing protein [Ureibacillus sp.]
MSNLLNNQRSKKRLLDRGPKIVPDQEFKLDEVNETTTVEVETEKPVEKDTKRRADTRITSVRVTKTTRNKINTLIQLGKAESVDQLIDILLDEYIETNLVKDEKKTYNLVFEIIQKKDR